MVSYSCYSFVLAQWAVYTWPPSGFTDRISVLKMWSEFIPNELLSGLHHIIIVDIISPQFYISVQYHSLCTQVPMIVYTSIFQQWPPLGKRLSPKMLIIDYRFQEFIDALPVCVLVVWVVAVCCGFHDRRCVQCICVVPSGLFRISCRIYSLVWHTILLLEPYMVVPLNFKLCDHKTIGMVFVTVALCVPSNVMTIVVCLAYFRNWSSFLG